MFLKELSTLKFQAKELDYRVEDLYGIMYSNSNICKELINILLRGLHL